MSEIKSWMVSYSYKKGATEAETESRLFDTLEDARAFYFGKSGYTAEMWDDGYVVLKEYFGGFMPGPIEQVVQSLIFSLEPAPSPKGEHLRSVKTS